MSSFRQPLTGTRHTGGAYSAATGKWGGGSSAPINFTASVQPAPAQERRNLPEGYISDSAILLISDFELFSVVRGGQQSDEVLIRGETYQVVDVEWWENDVIPHYTAIVARPTQ